MNRFSFILFIILLLFQARIQAQRIVSLAPSLTKQIYLLNASDKLVGCTSYCVEAKAEGKPVVASAIDVNLERLVSLEPQIVLATSLTKPSLCKSLESLGIRVVMFPYPKSYINLNEQFLELAEVVGKKALAQEIVKNQLTRLDRLKERVPEGPKKTLFMEIGAKPLFTVIRNTFMHDYIEFVGCSNIVADLTHGAVSRESILLRNPDVVVVVTMGVVGEEEKMKWMSFPNLSATRSKRIFVIDSSKASSPSPVDFVNVVEELIELIYSN